MPQIARSHGPRDEARGGREEHGPRYAPHEREAAHNDDEL
jgi:hypothetical protein